MTRHYNIPTGLATNASKVLTNAGFRHLLHTRGQHIWVNMRFRSYLEDNSSSYLCSAHTVFEPAASGDTFRAALRALPK